MVNKATFLTAFFLLLTTGAFAQELNAVVTVNAPNLTLIDRKVIDDFESTVRDFLNNTTFTDLTYERDERINCNFTFSVTQEINESEFNVELLVQSTRPVFGSDYETTLINYLDKPALIEYEQFQPLEFNRNNFTSPLVALLSFYANIIVGMDKDSFAPMGGEPFFRRAEDIINTLPQTVSAKDKAWTNRGQRTRFRLLQEILNPRARPYRQMIYDYHRQGLDVMSEDVVAGRAIMANSLSNLKDVRQDIPNSILISIFSASKTQELIDVFVPAPQQERQMAYGVMSSVDPANINKFRLLR